MNTILKLLVSGILMAALSGCGTSQKLQVSGQTTGQELVDLKKAYDAGVITEKEYNNQREAILDRN